METGKVYVKAICDTSEASEKADKHRGVMRMNRAVLTRIEKLIDTLPYKTATVTIVTPTATYTLEKERPTVIHGFCGKEQTDGKV